MLITASAFVAAVWLLALGVLWLNLRSIPPVGEPAAPSRLPSLSVVIPARNEERDIERCVRAIAGQDYPSLEVIVVDDQSNDGTPRILDQLKEELSGLRVIEGSEPPDGWLGKPWALQQGGETASSELVLFCDADVFYAPGALRRIVGELVERGSDALTLLPRMEMSGFWEHALMVQLPVSAFMLLPLFLTNSVRAPWIAVGGGTGNLLTRETWRRIGTHESLRQAVVDDIALMQLVRKEGGTTALVLANELVSVRMYRGFREIVRGFSKNAYHALGGSLPRAVTGLAIVALLQLFPFLVLVAGLVDLAGGGVWSTAHSLGAAACAEIVAGRVVLFRRFGYRIDNALLGQPLMATVWISIMGWSIWKVGVRRQLQWRGRGYDARAARFGK